MQWIKLSDYERKYVWNKMHVCTSCMQYVVAVVFDFPFKGSRINKLGIELSV
jgi:hypothetical protein